METTAASNTNGVSEEQQANTGVINNNISKEFNMLVDKVYSKILDLAKDKNIFHLASNASSNNANDGGYDGSEYEIRMEEENQNAYAPQNILTSNTILYGILKHTCLNCSKSYEQAKCLRRHFILEHIVYKPTYQCSHCMGDHQSIYELDKYLQHLLTKHNTLNDLETIYDLFILKYTQDVFCDYFVEGRFYLDPQQLKHVNKLKFGKENCTLIQKMHSKIYENYFICDDAANLCKPPITLTSKSMKSNLLYSQITKANVFKEIIEYLRIDPNLMNDEAVNAYMTIQHISAAASNENPKIQADNCKYNQCKFCMKIFRECNAYKEHVMEVHTFNEFCNRCLVCPYCKQLLKSNFDKNVDANVLLNVHVRKCIALKSDFSYVFNSFKTTGASNFSQAKQHISTDDENNLASSIINTTTASLISSNSKSKKRDDAFSEQPIASNEVTRKKQKLNSVSSNTNGNSFKSRKICYLCSFTTDSNMDKHIIEEHTTIKCLLCEKDILKTQLNEHLKQVHIPDSTEICYLCSLTSADECKNHLSLDEFLNHKCVADKLDDYKNNLKCPVCNESVSNESDDDDLVKLKYHFQQNHSKSVYNCELCTANFRNPICLIEHMLFEHRNDVTSESTSQIGIMQLQCFKCFNMVNYKNENDLKLHEISEICINSSMPVVEVETEVTTTKETTVVPQEEILMETVETIIEPARLPIIDHRHHHHDEHNGTEEDNLNSNSYINPLSILSNVSTSVPHILAVESSIVVEPTVDEEQVAEVEENNTSILQANEAIVVTSNNELVNIKLEEDYEKITKE